MSHIDDVLPKSNYHSTAEWLKAAGKEPGPEALSVQVGCHLEEFAEFLDCLSLESNTGLTAVTTNEVAAVLKALATNLKRGSVKTVIHDREAALDALCDSEVTGNGVAYLAGLNKPAADAAVLASNWDKFEWVGGERKPVILPGGKIGKREGWVAPDLSRFV